MHVVDLIFLSVCLVLCLYMSQSTTARYPSSLSVYTFVCLIINSESCGSDMHYDTICFVP